MEVEARGRPAGDDVTTDWVATNCDCGGAGSTKASPVAARSASTATSDTIRLPADPAFPCSATRVDSASRPSRSSVCRLR